LVRKRRRNRYFWGTVTAIAVATFGYVVIAAWFQSKTSPYAFEDLWIPRAVDCLVVFWLFWVGSSIGSFLNVVAWRMPRGQSINGLSHCPRCNQRLSARDNWPVFGWLALRGRCRTCRLPISYRYPVTEMAVGLTITAIGFVELYAGQWNLPFVADQTSGEGPLAMPNVSMQMIGISVYHTVAVAGAWALGLIRFDGHRLPRRLVGFVWAAVIIPMLGWPPVMLVTWRATVPQDWPAWSFMDAIVRVLCGLVAATIIARSLTRYLCPTADPKLDPMGSGTKRLIDLIFILAVPGIVIGWQGLLGVVLMTSLIGAAWMRLWGGNRDGMAYFCASVPIAFSLQLVLWRPLEQLHLWPSSQASPLVILIAAGLVLVVPALLRQRATILDTDRQSTPRSEVLG
jgi:leader peptidase (prepilin peptidase)/N-methyltransferase